jgi:hypothetical protein
MSTEAALKALSNSQLASGAQIPATKHRTVNDAIIEELFDAQSRGDVLNGVQSALSLSSGDEILLIRGGQAYLIDESAFGLISDFVDLGDVSITSPLNDQVVVYNSSTSRYTLKNLNAISTGAGTAVQALALNATTVDANNTVWLRATVSYDSSQTLTFSNVGTLTQISLQLTNTNANTITFSGVTFYFKTDDLPSGVSFAANALTFPADSAVKYNLVAEKFDGSTFDAKIEVR